MKIVTVVGARPQFVKAAAVSRAVLAIGGTHVFPSRIRLRKQIREILVHTGQHYDFLMDRIFFEELKLPEPDYRLGVGSGSHAEQTGRILESIGAVLEKESPQVVIVYGDTNSTLAGALAAAKLNIPVAHVEAGLRSYRRAMPEEINRVLTDHLSTFLFCPTDQAVRNLLKEGIKEGNGRVVRKVGDVMYDSILYYSALAEERSHILDVLGFRNPKSAFAKQQYYLATLHRAENTDNPRRLRSILSGLNAIGKHFPVILPLHPRTKKMMQTYGLFSGIPRVRWIAPVSYFDMVLLEKNAKAILTDSGGIQKEAYWFGVPCFTLRDETEWKETVHHGWNTLVGADKGRIVEEVRRREATKGLPKKRKRFGDGKASDNIVRTLLKYFS